MAEPLVRLEKGSSRYEVTKVLIHRAGKASAPSSALRSGVKAVTVDQLGSVMGMAK
jgi:hypothetical protein